MTHKKCILALTLLILTAAVGCSKVPDLTGMTKEQVQTELTKDKLQMGAITYAHQDGKTTGTVLDQDPKPKEKIPDNKIIAIVLQSDGTTAQNGGPSGNTGGPNTNTGGNQTPVNPTVPVPDLTGHTQAEAEALLNQAGLQVGEMPVVLNDQPPGKVFSQDPHAGTPVPAGTFVSFSTASDALVTVPPQVVGQPQATAEQMIKNAQLVPEVEYDVHPGPDPVGNVFECPTQGLRIAKGQTIVLKVKQDAATVPAHLRGMTLQQAQLTLYQSNLTPVVHYVYDPANIQKVTDVGFPDNYSLAKYSQVGITVGTFDMRQANRYVVLAQPQMAAFATQRIQSNKIATLFGRR